MNETRLLEINDLYRLRLISDPQISPDGKRVAFVLRQPSEEENSYISNIYVVDADGVCTQFTSGNKDAGPRWSPDGRYLAFLSRRQEKPQIYVMPSNGGESVPLTDRTLGAGVPFWSPDSGAIAFIGPVSTTPEEDESHEKAEKQKEPTKIIERSSYKLDDVGFIWNRRRHLFRVDLDSRATQQLTDGDFHDDHPTWSPDGREIAFVSNRQPRWDTSLGSDIYVVSREGGEARRVTSDHAFSNPVFSPDGRRIAVTGRLDPEEAFRPERIYSVDRGGEDIRDELGDWDGNLGNDVSSDVVRSADDLSLRWGENGIVFLGTVRGECTIHRAEGGAVTALLPGRHTIGDFSLVGDAIAYTCSDATHPAEVFLKRSGTTTQLTHENDGFLASVRLARPERFTYVGARGEESEGWLLPPHCSGDGKRPLIVYIHGGPATAHGEAFFFEYQLLAAQGFGVFYPNIHGSSSYGRDYQTSILHDWGNVDYQDVLAGTEAAVARSWVDPERVGIVGGSYGGYMTNWAMTHTDRFKVGVAERCLSNLVSFYGTTDFGWLWNRAWGVYPEEDVQRLWNMSPIKYVENVRGPLMVMHSERDDRTPLEQAEQMFNALRRLGKETKMVVFPEETHELSRSGTPSRRTERLGYITEWFKRHL